MEKIFDYTYFNAKTNNAGYAQSHVYNNKNIN